MDGTRSDRMRNGELDRPPSLSVITRDYPDIVIGLISGRYKVSAPMSVEGAESVRVSVLGHIEQQYTLHMSDFAVCWQMAKLFAQDKHGPGPISAFPSEPLADLRARIAAKLQVEFAGRGA